MANVNSPRGFVPVRYLDGSAWNGATNIYYIPATDNTNQYNVGDPVKSAAGADANGISQVTKALGTDTVRGVIVGVLASTPNGQSLVGTTLDLATQNIPVAKARDYYVLVADDSSIVFELQDDGLNTLTATSANKNASFTVANPTAPQQNSASVLNTASVATTSTLNLKLFGLAQKPNNAFGAYAVWNVVFNMHELRGAVAGV
jgi:hypothetical protein